MASLGQKYDWLFLFSGKLVIVPTGRVGWIVGEVGCASVQEEQGGAKSFTLLQDANGM